MLSVTVDVATGIATSYVATSPVNAVDVMPCSPPSNLTIQSRCRRRRLILEAHEASDAKPVATPAGATASGELMQRSASTTGRSLRNGWGIRQLIASTGVRAGLIFVIPPPPPSPISVPGQTRTVTATIGGGGGASLQFNVAAMIIANLNMLIYDLNNATSTGNNSLVTTLADFAEVASVATGISTSALLDLTATPPVLVSGPSATSTQPVMHVDSSGATGMSQLTEQQIIGGVVGGVAGVAVVVALVATWSRTVAQARLLSAGGEVAADSA